MWVVSCVWVEGRAAATQPVMGGGGDKVVGGDAAQ